MKRSILGFVLLVFISNGLFADNVGESEVKIDTIDSYYLNEVVVTSSSKYMMRGSYLCRMGYSASNLEYKNERLLITSTTSYQGLDDKMNMDQDYNTFYFESMKNSFVQQGKPATFGADLVISF